MVNQLTKNNRKAIAKSAISQVRPHVFVLAIYLFFMPIGAALTGIIGDLSPISLLSVLYMVTAVFCTLHVRRRLTRPAKFLLWYFVYSFITLLWGGIQTRWFITALALNMLTFLFAVTDKYNSHELKTIKIAVALSVVLTVFVALICQIRSMENRLVITIFSSIDPNEFSGSLCLCIAFLLSVLSESKQRILPIIGLICCAAIIVLTGSRGGILSMGVVVVIWFLLYGGRHRWKILLAIASILLVAFMLFFNNLGVYLFERLNIFKSLAADGGAGRLNIWRAGFAYFGRTDFLHKIFGSGFGTFMGTVNYIAPGHDSAYMAHNMWIDCLITGGIVGVVLLFLAFAAAFRYAYKNKNIWGVLCLVAFLISSVSIDTQYQKAFAVVFIIALVFGKDKSNAKNKHHSSDL